MRKLLNIADVLLVFQHKLSVGDYVYFGSRTGRLGDQRLSTRFWKITAIIKAVPGRETYWTLELINSSGETNLILLTDSTDIYWWEGNTNE